LAYDLVNEGTYDLEERTALFGERIIELAQALAHNRVNEVLIKQIVRSGTSVGANYMEADSAGSKRDFKYKIDLCRKEAKETKHWLRMIAKANPKEREAIRSLWQEAHELTLIFSSIAKSCENQ
jgi:four helix bundle protein